MLFKRHKILCIEQYHQRSLLRLLVLVATVCCLIGCSGASSSKAAGIGFIQQKNMQIVDHNEDPVILRGINLGGWLMWEAWMWGGLLTLDGKNSEHHIIASLQEVIGNEKTELFRQRVYDEYITEADVKRISALGYNSVRVPFNHDFIEDPDCAGCLSDRGLRILERLLSWCATHKIYAILDLHSAPGGQSDLFTADPDETNLWESIALQDRTVALWRALADHFKDTAWIGGYDLLNEPYTVDSRQLSELYDRIGTAIREVDSKHIIFLEGNFAGHILNTLEGDPPTNSVYSFHAYPFGGRDLQADLKDHIEFARSKNRPLWVGEYGEVAREEIMQWTNVYRSTSEIIGWAPWTWKRVATDNPAPQTFVATSPWRDVILGITLGWSIESLDVETAIDQFLQAVQVENTTEDTEYSAYTQ